MNYTFEYIDIILLAMIAGFIFLRLRGILGKRSGFDLKAPSNFEEIIKNPQFKKQTQNATFDKVFHLHFDFYFEQNHHKLFLLKLQSYYMLLLLFHHILIQVL